MAAPLRRPVRLVLRAAPYLNSPIPSWLGLHPVSRTTCCTGVSARPRLTRYKWVVLVQCSVMKLCLHCWSLGLAYHFTYCKVRLCEHVWYCSCFSTNCFSFSMKQPTKVNLSQEAPQVITCHPHPQTLSCNVCTKLLFILLLQCSLFSFLEILGKFVT